MQQKSNTKAVSSPLERQRKRNKKGKRRGVKPRQIKGSSSSHHRSHCSSQNTAALAVAVLVAASSSNGDAEQSTTIAAGDMVLDPPAILLMVVYQQVVVSTRLFWRDSQCIGELFPASWKSIYSRRGTCVSFQYFDGRVKRLACLLE
jgi:hypothetical protein